jgi:hypothetical protein
LRNSAPPGTRCLFFRSEVSAAISRSRRTGSGTPTGIGTAIIPSRFPRAGPRCCPCRETGRRPATPHPRRVLRGLTAEPQPASDGRDEHVVHRRVGRVRDHLGEVQVAANERESAVRPDCVAEARRGCLFAAQRLAQGGPSLPYSTRVCTGRASTENARMTPSRRRSRLSRNNSRTDGEAGCRGTTHVPTAPVPVSTVVRGLGAGQGWRRGVLRASPHLPHRQRWCGAP